MFEIIIHHLFLGAVNGYFNSGVNLPASSFYDKNGRAYPDIAAAGVDVEVVQNGKNTGVSGTSCSAPIVAGLISLINNERIKTGKGSLGFLNPFLYANPDAFTDITVGNNKHCPVGAGCCCDGFDAAPGWDPVTGEFAVTLPRHYGKCLQFSFQGLIFSHCIQVSVPPSTASC